MRYFTVFLSLICILFAADAARDSAKADKRVAFVVGNGAYKNVAQLPNPPVDAKAMAACCAMSVSKWSRAPTSPATG